jgi:hypothetical protein
MIQEAGRVLRATSPIEDFELEGVVITLTRPAVEEVGTVTVLGFVDERTRRVKMKLREPEYQIAVRAHGERIPITCVGTLVQDGRSFLLDQPRDFQLAPDLEA